MLYQGIKEYRHSLLPMIIGVMWFSNIAVADTLLKGTNVMTVVDIQVSSDAAYAGELVQGTNAGLKDRGISIANPQSFVQGKTLTHDPCVLITEDIYDSVDEIYNNSLLVRYKDVNPSVHTRSTIQPFTIEFKLFPENAEDVNWQVHGFPKDYEATFSVDNQSVGRLRDIKTGGVYYVENTYMGTSTVVNAILPLASADIIDWLDTEVRKYRQWVSENDSYVENKLFEETPDSNSPSGFSFVANSEKDNSYRYSMEKLLGTRWLQHYRVVSASFDYRDFEAVADGLQAPCLAYDINRQIQSGKIGRLFTVNGAVIHSSKINNMLWALFSQYYGVSVPAIRNGSHYYELAFKDGVDVDVNVDLWPPSEIGLDIDIKVVLDNESSLNSLRVAEIIHEWLRNGANGHLRNVLTPDLLATMQAGDSDNFWHEWLWPSHLPMSDQSTFSRPNTLVEYPD